MIKFMTIVNGPKMYSMRKRCWGRDLCLLKYGITTWRNSHSDCLTHMHSGKYRCFINRTGSLFPKSWNFISSNFRRHSSAFRRRSPDPLTRLCGFMTMQFGQNTHQVTPLSSWRLGRAKMLSPGTQWIVPEMSSAWSACVLCVRFPCHLFKSFRLKFLWVDNEVSQIVYRSGQFEAARHFDVSVSIGT